MGEFTEQILSFKECVNVLGKLQKIQSELFVPKGQKNNFGGYNYRSAEDILVAVKPLCEKYKCVLLLDMGVARLEDRFYVKACAGLIDLESGEAIRASGLAREEDIKKGMDSSQITGSATSYARKYALAGLFCIDNEKDSDKTNKKFKDGSEAVTDENGEPIIDEATGEVKRTINADQINAIKAELERTGVSISKVLDSVKRKRIEELEQADYVKVMASFKKTPDKGKEGTK